MQSIDESNTGALRLASTARGNPLATHVVLVHGFTQTGSSWDLIANELSADYYVQTVDLPGHGGSTNIRVEDLDATAALLGATTGRAIYVGYSLGGRVALTLAVRAPELVEALVLVSASPGIDAATERDNRRRNDETLAERLSPSDDATTALSIAAFVDEWLAQPLFSHLDDESADRASRRANSPAGLADSLRSAGAGAMRPLHNRLVDLAMPVLALAGERDLRYLEIAQQMAAAIGKNAQWQKIAGAGHAVPFEKSADFVRALGAFLANLQIEQT